MAVTHKPIFVQIVKNGMDTIVNGDGTTAQTIVTAGTDGSSIMDVAVTSGSTGEEILQVYIGDGTDYLIGEVTIPIGTGTDGGTTATMNILTETALANFVQADGSLALEGTNTLKIGAKTAITDNEITIAALYGDY